MPHETPFLRGDSAKEYHRFLRRVRELEEQKAAEIARGKQREAEILEEAAQDAEDDEVKRIREVAAQSKKAAADEWRKGMGLDK